MVLHEIISKNILFVLLVFTSAPLTHSKCFWGYFNAFMGKLEDSLGDKKSAPSLITRETNGKSDGPIERIQSEEDDYDRQQLISSVQITVPLVLDSRSSRPLFALSSKKNPGSSDAVVKESSGKINNAYSLDVSMDLKRDVADTEDRRREELEITTWPYVTAIIIGLGMLVIFRTLLFYWNFRALHSKLQCLEGKFIEASTSTIRSPKRLEMVNEKLEASDTNIPVLPKWSVNKIFYFLKQLTTDVAEADNTVKLLTDEFLKEIANYMLKVSSSEENLRENLKILTPESLLRLGKFRRHHASMHHGKGDEF